MTRLRFSSLGLGTGIAILLLILPLFLHKAHLLIATEILVWILYAISFNIMFGYAGMVPFGHGAYFGIGAYSAALMFNYLPHAPLPCILLLAGMSALVGGVAIGFFCVRFSGPYFAFATCSFQMFLYAVALKWKAVTNGDDGMGVTRPDLYIPGLGQLSLRNIPTLYTFTLVVVAVGVLACYLFVRTPLGNSLVSTRENDGRSAFLGYNVFQTRLASFSIAAFFAGLAGSLFVFLMEFVSTSAINFDISMSVVLMSMIGGTGQFLGPAVGAAFYIIVQNWLSSITTYWMILMGLLFVFVVLYLQGGIVSLIRPDLIRRRRRGLAR